MAQQLTSLEEDITRKITTLELKSIQELASLAVSCKKDWERREKEKPLTFAEFLMVCLIKQDVTMELKHRYRLTRNEIGVAKIAIALYQIEMKVGGEKRAKFFKNFLYEYMMLENCSPEICEMYGLRYIEK